MSLADVAVAVLLVLGVGLELVACLGVLVMRDAFDRLHYVGLAGFGVLAIAVAILVRESFSLIADKALATAALLVLTGPVLVHVTARSGRLRRLGQWQRRPAEKIERLAP